MESIRERKQLQVEDIIIRLAEEKDFSDIVALDREIFPGSPINPTTALQCIFMQRSYVAVTPTGNVVIGYILANMGEIKEAKVVEISAFGVAEKLQNQGIGSCLLERVINDSFSWSDDAVMLHTNVENKSISLYHSVGFRVVKLVEDYYEGEHLWLNGASKDAYIMMKPFIPFEYLQLKLEGAKTK